MYIKNVALSLLLAILMAFNVSLCFAVEQNTKSQVEVKKQQVVVQQIDEKQYQMVNSLDVVNNPSNYLNKKIKMAATFDKFSTLGLDYKPAFRNSKDYISFLIRRNDIVDHIVPLSEMKLFLKRDVAEKFIDLETGDKIEVYGRVFSQALGDPWIEVEHLKIIKKMTEKKKL